MKKINWKLILIVLGIVILGSLLLLYKIGAQYMWTDEVFSFHAAKMIIEKGQPLYDSGLLYGRAEIYNYLLAFSMKLFGANEFGSRIVNIPFALGTTLLSFFFVRDVFKQSKYRTILALCASLLYLTSNFTIASVRETRMYAMTVFLLTLSSFSFYKALISQYSTKVVKIKNWIFRYNIPWLVVFLASFYIGYQTQPITIILGVCILIFYILRFILKRRKEDLLFVILLTTIAFVAVYLLYHTLNIYQVFLALSPEWAVDAPKLLYYPILLVRNFPGIALLSPLIIYSIFKYHKTFDIYLVTIFLVYILFISLQRAQHERYLEPVLAILPVILVTSIFRITEDIATKKSLLKVWILIAISLIIAIPQGYLLQKELREIDTYTHSSLAIYKKMEFNKLFTYLDTVDLKETTLIADYNSAFTLYEKGYKPNYILVTKARYELEQKKYDIYFHIPYLVYPEDLVKLKTDNTNGIVVLRDKTNFPDIEQYVTPLDTLNGPFIYITLSE